jgi:DNA modification methylase
VYLDGGSAVREERKINHMQEIQQQNTGEPFIVGQVELRPIEQLNSYPGNARVHTDASVSETPPKNREHKMHTATLVQHIEIWAIERLTLYDRNARIHSGAQVGQIARSIEKYGFIVPILVDGDGQVIAGHGRLMAARRLGMAQVPVIQIQHLSNTQIRQFRLADNQLTLTAEWDDDTLALELAALRAEDVDLSLLGFPEDELAAILHTSDISNIGLVDEDVVPEAPAITVTRPGDIWRFRAPLHTHRLLCGDVLSSHDLQMLVDGERSQLIFTDPPYSCGYTGKTARKLTILNDNLGKEFSGFLKRALENLLSINDGAVYICMSSSELHTLKTAFEAAGGHWSTFIIWAKNTFTLGRSDYQRQYEIMLYGWRQGAGHYWCGARDQGDVWFVDKPHRNDMNPCMKPVELIERAIENSSRPGDIVLDGFAGSGSTLIACQKMGRQARLMELDPRYCDVAVQRWERYTGMPATLASDGRSYSQVSQERLPAAA